MGKPRKTGNVLFDIVWAEYPPRNGRKETKAPSRKLFEKMNPSEEEAYDMVAWIKKDKESRESLRKQGKFCKEPQDMIRFLRNEAWGDEIGVEVTDSQRYEKKRSSNVYTKNIQDKIDQWASLIHDWSVEKLRATPAFIYNYNTYPEFKAWVQKELPNREPAKADNPPNPPLSKPVIAVVAPAEPTKKQKLTELYRDVVEHGKKTNPLLMKH